ncbi:MAG: hypothetical protein SGPRY_008689, partial [Prymnesium sp.]
MPALHGVPFAFAVTDMRSPGNRIVSVNPAFEDLTGYTAVELIGENLRLLQGEETEQDRLDIMVEAIRAVETVQVKASLHLHDCAS